MINAYELVTDRFIAELEKGKIPWAQPWSSDGIGAYNRLSKKPYSLLNQMMLTYDGEYATYKQWQSLGGQVRKGEKAQIVVFWKINKFADDKDLDDDGNPKIKSVPILKHYYVFHISQVDGVEPLEWPDRGKGPEPIEAGENLIHDYVTREGVKFSAEPSARAYYSSIEDMIIVPEKSQYSNINEYYSTTFHELIHSTGH